MTGSTKESLHMTDRNGITHRHCLGVLVGLLITIQAGANLSAQAAPLSSPPIFTVNTNSDAVAGGLLSNGACHTAPDNDVCPLRAAIQKADNCTRAGLPI